MELVVLGSSAAYAKSRKACSGYLIRWGKSSVLLDIGTGSVSNLFRWIDPATLDGIVITHLHPDHFLDIYPLRYYLQFDAKISSPIPVFAPAGALEKIGGLLTSEGLEEFKRIYRFVAIKEDKVFKAGEISFQFKELPHVILTYGVKVDGGKIVYTSDCSYEGDVVSFAEGAKLLLCEATLQEKDAHLSIGHLTAKEAGKIAQEAGVRKLILTHIWPTYDENVSLAEAKMVYNGEVELACENKVFKVEE